jgi:hypothetical protein
MLLDAEHCMAPLEPHAHDLLNYRKRLREWGMLAETVTLSEHQHKTYCCDVWGRFRFNASLRITCDLPLALIPLYTSSSLATVESEGVGGFPFFL